MNAPTILDRKQFIGGSDAAAILGLSPRDTALDIFLYKTGQKKKVFTPAQQRALKRGKRREPEVIEDLIELHGIKVTKRSTTEKPNRYIDPEHAFLSAEVDFEWEVTEDVADRFNLDPALIGTIQNGEVKTSHPFVASLQFGEEETDEIPVEYYTQGMHGLMVTARQLTMVVVGVDSNDPLVSWVKRDDETVAGMRAQLINFWNQHVLTGVPPKPVNLPDVLELFGRKTASRIEANEETLELLQRFNKAKDDAKAAEDVQIECKFQIGLYMLGATGITLANGGKLIPGAGVKGGNHELLSNGVPILIVQKQSQQRLDGDAVKEKYPDVAVECQKTIEFFKFAKPKKGKSR